MSAEGEGEDELLEEGKARVYLSKESNVFFNPLQKLQRDITIVVLEQFIFTNFWSKGVQILDAFAGCGIRSIRYALEVPQLRKVVANDANLKAVQTIQHNLSLNNFGNTQVEATCQDALETLNEETYDIIDLDPCGSAAPHLHSAVKNVVSGGLLCVADTDLAALTAKRPDQCWSKYGVFPVKANYAKEMALRIVLGRIQSIATACHREIKPMLCFATDFYIRLFVRINDADRIPHVQQASSGCKMGFVLQCSQCDGFEVFPGDNSCIYTLCRVCDGKPTIVGPVWIGPLHDLSFVQSLLPKLHGLRTEGTLSRTESLLQSIAMETCSAPLGYSLESISRQLCFPVANMTYFLNVLQEEGYTVSSSHTNGTLFKTTCRADVVYRIAVECLRHKYPQRCSSVGVGEKTSILRKILKSLHRSPLNISFGNMTGLSADTRSMKREGVRPCELQHVPPEHFDFAFAGSNGIRSQVCRNAGGRILRVYANFMGKQYPENSFADIHTAVEAAQDGDTIVLAVGTHYGPVKIDKSIVLVGEQAGPAPTILAEGAEPTLSLMRGNIQLRNLRILQRNKTRAKKRAYALLVVNLHTRVLMEHCIVDSASSTCITAADLCSLTIKQCSIEKGGHAGVYVSGKATMEIIETQLCGHTGAGVEISGGSKTTIERCYIRRCGTSGIYVHSFGSMDVSKSDIDQCRGAGIEIGSYASSSITHCMIRRGSKGGVLLHSQGRSSMIGNTIYKNALAGVDIRGLASAYLEANHICNGRASGVYVSSNGHVCLVRNVIIGHPRAGVEVFLGHTEIQDDAPNVFQGNGCRILVNVQMAENLSHLVQSVPCGL